VLSSANVRQCHASTLESSISFNVREREEIREEEGEELSKTRHDRLQLPWGPYVGPLVYAPARRLDGMWRVDWLALWTPLAVTDPRAAAIFGWNVHEGARVA
jgi:hypothetical protein